MNYNKFDIITFDDNNKVVVLEKIEYEGTTYLYVDKVNQEETNTLKKFHILRVDNDYLQKETDTEILTNILPLFSNKIKLEDI